MSKPLETALAEKGKPSLKELFKERESLTTTDADFFARHGITEHESALQKAFAKLRREADAREIERAKHLLAKAAPLASETKIELLNCDDPSVRLRAADAIHGPLGITAAAAAINVQQVNAQQAIVVPLVAGEDAEAFAKFLGGENE